VEDGFGFSEDADRNMSCHAGVVAVFGSEYGTISIVMKHAQRREKMDLFDLCLCLCLCLCSNSEP